MKFRLSPIAGAVLALYVLPGAAQTTGPAAGEEPAQKDATQLREVRVQAEASNEYKVDAAASPKYTAPLRDTPKSVTVISSQILQDTAATSLQDALRTVPGITFQAGEGGQPIADRPMIRGLNSTSSLFVDGIRDIGSQTRDVFALESVEVTKGADSVYGGRGSGGGSINLVSKQAKADDFASASLQLGTADTLRGSVDRNWQLNDSTALRLNVMGTRGGTPGRDDAVDYDKLGVAGSLAFGLGTPSRVVVDYYHLKDSGMPDYSIPYDLSTGLPATETMGVNRNNFYGLKNRDFRDGETDIGTVSLVRDLDGGMVLRNTSRYGRSVNSYVVSNPDDSAGNVARGQVYRSSKNRWSQSDTFANVTDLSGKLATGPVTHSFHTGVEVSREKKEQDGYTVTSTNPPWTGTAASRDCTLAPAAANTVSYDCTDLYNPNPNDVWQGSVTRNHTPTFYTTDVVGLYAFDTIEFHPQWQANVGLRWDSYETEARKPAYGAAAATYAQSSDDFINYQAGLVFKPVETGSIYLSYATEATPAQLGSGDEDGASTGSPSTCTSRCTLDNTRLDPEESATIELGSKWELFDQRLMLTAAVFDTTRKNAYVQTGPTPQDVEPVGKTRVRGAELSFSGGITEDWQIFGGYSYLDSELVRGAVGSLAVGRELPNTAKNSFSLFSTYKLLEHFSLGGGAYYMSKVYGNTTGTPTAPDKHIPDYWRFDAMAGYDINPSVALQLNIQNLTDEVYYTKAYASHYAALGTGRQGLLSVNVKF